MLDSGDYPAAAAEAIEQGGLAELCARREEARAARRLYDIGYAAIVEPSISNMGYITTSSPPRNALAPGRRAVRWPPRP
jgi:2-furoyl-CoA dehydrogenase large subunit